VVFLIEFLMNQNARDTGAAESPASTPEVIKILMDAEIGMAQIPCPEIACLGFERLRSSGQSIRQALEGPEATACCQSLAAATAERIQCYINQGYEVLAVLGGNEQSPGCAVHNAGNSETQLTAKSGVFMKMLAVELTQCGLQIQFHGIRDADSKLLKEDMEWLRDRITRANSQFE
jgi:predicted secreted protein